MAPKKVAAAQLVDASRNVQLNPVRLLDGRIVAWAVAYPRPEHD